MTNSYNSSKLPRLLIIHGLNNNLEGFKPLRHEFQTRGYDCHLITLPGHGNDRNETRSFQSALKAFDKQMKEFCHEPYVVIAFSQGALYLQLWIDANQDFAPKAQVLLAPALYVNHQDRIEKLLSFLPSFAFIPSQTPKRLRRYKKLHIWEYRTLFEAVGKFQVMKKSVPVPTMVLVDPQDELIHAKELEKSLEGAIFQFIRRPVIKAPGLAKHHVLFHPDYFESRIWEDLITKILSFISMSESV